MESTPGPTSVVAPQTMAAQATSSGVFAETTGMGPAQTILLVEDEAFVRKATAEALQSAGYSVVIATSASVALEAYSKRSRPVDLLLSDVVMPGMSGRDLAAEFTILCPRARVLLMTGYAHELALCELPPDCKMYLRKPFSVTVLLRKVREALGGNSAEPETTASFPEAEHTL